MENKLHEEIKKSSEKFSEHQMPLDALSDFRNYQTKREAPKGSVLSSFLIAGLLLLLVGSNVFWFLNQSQTLNETTSLNQNAKSQSNSLTEKIASVKTEIDNQSLTPKSTESRTDTIYITKYVNAENKSELNSNTISISKKEYYSFQKSNKIISSLEQSMAQLEDKLEQIELSRKSLKGIGNNKNSVTESSSKFINKKASIFSDKSNSSDLLQEVVFLDKLPSRMYLLEYGVKSINVYSPIYIDLDRKQSFLEFIKPKTLSLLTEGGVHFEKADQLKLLKGNHFGLGLSTLFSNHVRGKLFVDFARAKNEFEESIILPNNFPSVIPPESSILDELYVTSKHSSATIGIDYLFKPIRFLRPYVGINYRVGRQQYVEINYKYTYNNQGLRISADNSSIVTLQHLGLSIGSDINLTNNFDAFLSLSYSRGLKGDINSLLLFNTGIQYHF